MAEPLGCRVPDCDRTRSPRSPDFCPGHELECERELAAMCRDVDHTTELAAAFSAWCAERGQPNPYD